MSTMKNESKMDEPEAGGASRNNKKVSSEDVTNTNTKQMTKTMATQTAPASSMPSKQHLRDLKSLKASQDYMRKIWQKDAEEAGGPQARIVVSEGAVKEIIFDYMNGDNRHPMNIAQIHQVN
jgi:hypothetical protein